MEKELENNNMFKAFLDKNGNLKFNIKNDSIFLFGPGFKHDFFYKIEKIRTMLPLSFMESINVLNIGYKEFKYDDKLYFFCNPWSKVFKNVFFDCLFCVKQPHKLRITYKEFMYDFYKNNEIKLDEDINISSSGKKDCEIIEEIEEKLNRKIELSDDPCCYKSLNYIYQKNSYSLTFKGEGNFYFNIYKDKPNLRCIKENRILKTLIKLNKVNKFSIDLLNEV